MKDVRGKVKTSSKDHGYSINSNSEVILFTATVTDYYHIPHDKPVQLCLTNV